MVQLYSMFWIFAVFFAVIGAVRGLAREIVALGGIVLALFIMFQFDALLRGIFLASVPRDQAFFVQFGLFTAVVYFAYQTRSFGSGRRGGDGPRRTRTADAILGGLFGALNGYLIWGAIWYFLDINDYPFSPLIVAPAPGSISAANLNTIPLVLLGGAMGASTEVLLVIVVVLFLFVLFIT